MTQRQKGASAHSNGFQTLLLTIEEISGGFAYGLDNFSIPRKVPMTLQATKGAMPIPGEQWLISKSLTGTWMFLAITNSPGGVAITQQFPFTYQTPNIGTGAPMYTPQVGEILVDAWISPLTAFNGTTPKGDIGSFDGVTTGLFAAANAALDMTHADTSPAGIGIRINTTLPTLAGLSSAHGKRVAPSPFTGTNPILLVVSANGQSTGAATGATQGSGILYLETIPPA